MKVIVNKEQTDLTFSFEGFDYTFSAGKPSQVEDNLYAHLQELVPLAFDFEPELKKIDKVSEVQKVETHNVFPGGKFGIQTANLTRVKFPNMNVEMTDDLPNDGKIDNDGVEFYGKGLEDDKP